MNLANWRVDMSTELQDIKKRLRKAEALMTEHIAMLNKHHTNNDSEVGELGQRMFNFLESRSSIPEFSVEVQGSTNPRTLMPMGEALEQLGKYVRAGRLPADATKGGIVLREYQQLWDGRIKISLFADIEMTIPAPVKRS